MTDNHLKAVARKDFFAFSRKAILELAGEKIDNDAYLEYPATEFTAFVDEPTNRLIVNLPPRHVKSKLFSVCLAARIFAHKPSAKIMVVTYTERLAAVIARRIRGILQAEWFRFWFMPTASSGADGATPRSP